MCPHQTSGGIKNTVTRDFSYWDANILVSEVNEERPVS